ncbi:hypothetical protein ERJ75_000129700 [Trypanosoma vivax]|nr:hypothetical protein ERJ75_000129700 [Trypanosoma vivax]
MFARCQLTAALCVLHILVMTVPTRTGEGKSMGTYDAVKICGLSASLKFTAKTCEDIVEQALRIEKTALEKIESTEVALRAAAEKITKVDTGLEKATEPLRRLQQDLMAVETAVNAAWSKFDVLRSGVRAVARDAISIAANATAAAGRIDNFITAFATAESSNQKACIMNASDAFSGFTDDKYAVVATLQNELKGCTYENYTLNGAQNVTVRTVDDVVTLGVDSTLAMGGIASYDGTDGLNSCPFLRKNFTVGGGKPMTWGGFWTMKNPANTEIGFNREKRHILVSLARAFGELELQLSNNTSRPQRRGRRATETIPKLAAAVYASLLVSRHGEGTMSFAGELVDRIAIETEAAKQPTNMTTAKTTNHRRPMREQRRHRASAAAILGRVALITSLCFMHAFNNPLIS